MAVGEHRQSYLINLGLKARPSHGPLGYTAPRRAVVFSGDSSPAGCHALRPSFSLHLLRGRQRWHRHGEEPLGDRMPAPFGVV